MSIVLFFLVQNTQKEIRNNQNATFKTLSAPQKIMGIDMPKGTELELFEPDVLSSFREAKFPQPVAFGKFQINRMQIPRGVDIKLFDDHSTTLYGQGTDEVEGWRCHTTTFISVFLDENGKIIGLESCGLAQAYTLKNIKIMNGSIIFRSENQKYPDHFVSTDYWEIHNQSTTYKQIPIDHGDIYLDKNKKLIGIENSKLTKNFTLGRIQYPKGTEFNLLVHPLTKYETWLFIPPHEKNAIAKDGTIYTDQQAILQKPNGEVDQVFNSNDSKILFRMLN